MAGGGVRRSVWAAVVGWLAALAVVVVALEARRSSQPPPAAAIPQSETQTPAPEPAALTLRERKALERRTVPDDPVPYIDGLVWGDIDLREAQAVMPDNLYWELGAPSKDPAVLEARELEKKRRNEEYGRVLAGDANEDEVRAYYGYRERLSTDYLEFAQWMRNRYGDTLDEKFKGLLDLSIKLHTARLAQMPADLEAALEHTRTREKIREDWRRQQEEFDSASR